MKEVKAIVKNFKVNDIINNLVKSGYPNITISISEGTGTFEGYNAGISTQFSISDSQVAKIELVCADFDADLVANIISRYGRTGHSGDGLIYISELSKAIKVKTGDEIHLDVKSIKW